MNELTYKINTVQNIRAFAVRASLGTCGLRLTMWPFVAMSRAIQDYFSVKDGLPNPKGSLRSQLPSRDIALANKEVTRVLQENGSSVKCQRGKYNR